MLALCLILALLPINTAYALEECQGDNGKLGAAVIHCITIICHDCLYDHESMAIKRQ